MAPKRLPRQAERGMPAPGCDVIRQDRQSAVLSACTQAAHVEIHPRSAASPPLAHPWPPARPPAAAGIGREAVSGMSWRPAGRALPPTAGSSVGDVEDSMSALGVAAAARTTSMSAPRSRASSSVIHVDTAPTSSRATCWPRSTPRSTRPASTRRGRAAEPQGAAAAEPGAARLAAASRYGRQRELLAVQGHQPGRHAEQRRGAGRVAERRRSQALEAQIEQTQSTLTPTRPTSATPRSSRRWPARWSTSLARQGQTLNANQSAPIILRIADLDTMTVWTQVSEADVVQAHGRHAGVLHHARPARPPWQGKLRQILPTPRS